MHSKPFLLDDRTRMRAAPVCAPLTYKTIHRIVLFIGSCPLGVRIPLFYHKKRTPFGALFLWRRRRDSNPCAGNPRPNGLANRPLRPTWVLLRIDNFLFCGLSGGEGEIRTHGSCESPVFKTGSLNRSDTSPCRRDIIYHKFGKMSITN